MGLPSIDHIYAPPYDTHNTPYYTIRHSHPKLPCTAIYHINPNVPYLITTIQASHLTYTPPSGYHIHPIHSIHPIPITSTLRTPYQCTTRILRTAIQAPRPPLYPRNLIGCGHGRLILQGPARQVGHAFLDLTVVQEFHGG